LTDDQGYERKSELVYAITNTATGELLGAASLLNLSTRHSRCEIGYWIGLDHWSKGIGIEAVTALIAHANNSTKTGLTCIRSSLKNETA
jgi:RimJ/RimL family protein N-acetyltransferase